MNIEVPQLLASSDFDLSGILWLVFTTLASFFGAKSGKNK